MADLAFDADVGRPLTAQLASGNPLFIVCHGPAAMLAPRIHGASPFKGYRVTCFTNQEEEAVGLASRATWLLETDIKEKVGVNFSCGEIWKPYMVEDHPRAAKRTRTLIVHPTSENGSRTRCVGALDATPPGSPRTSPSAARTRPTHS